jgi:hypothetical protein
MKTFIRKSLVVKEMDIIVNPFIFMHEQVAKVNNQIVQDIIDEGPKQRIEKINLRVAE